jgi:chromosome partitioning protein
MIHGMKMNERAPVIATEAVAIAAPDHVPAALDRLRRPGHVIVLGNEKGGTGKSTTAMHVVVSLLRLGRSVGCIDLDSRQRSLARYVENRRGYAERSGAALPCPEVVTLVRSMRDSRAEAEDEERETFETTLARLRAENDFVVIDSPGSDSFLARLGHAAANTLITPLNDSFVDFDLLAHVDPETFDIRSPSHYAEMVWDSRKRRALRKYAPIDWVVMRNRLTTLDTHNKRRLADILDALAGRIGFRVAPGFGERVIYRELFPMGLTLLDLGEEAGHKLTMSHVAARQEMRSLVSCLNLPGIGDTALAL